MRSSFTAITALAILLVGACALAADNNLLTNASFEQFDKAILEQKGANAQPFAGWIYKVWEGQCELRGSPVAHSGKMSALLVGGMAPKQRIWQQQELEPGRYRITGYIRGLDLGKGNFGATTEFMFNEAYLPLGKEGTFGWSKVTFVGEVKEKKKVQGPSFGSWSPGFFWVDDVTMEKVGNDVPLTEKPIVDKEEAPLTPPGKLDGTAIRCPDCGSRNMPAWKTCYACGWVMGEKKPAAAAFTGPVIKPITSFEGDNPFNQGDGSDKATIVEEHATDGKKAMKLAQDWAVTKGTFNWAGYDYLKFDAYTDAKDALTLGIEFSDTATFGYWDRVNYSTIVPPGPSTIIIPLKQLFKGERSRPGGPLNLSEIVKWGLVFYAKPSAPLYVDNIRLERDLEGGKQNFDGLFAFDFQVDSSMPLMDGFTPIYPSSEYTEMKGYGFKNAKIQPGNNFANNMMQPDPLYQDFVNINSGDFVIDVPNGKYRVMVNVNRPSGFWGDLQRFTRRTISAQGKQVVTETEDDASFKKKFFKNYGPDDLPSDNVWERYVKNYGEKVFDVDVTDGQLRIGFEGDGNALSAMIVYPLDKLAEGQKFVKWVERQRQFHFDNNSKRMVHQPTGDALAPSDADKKNGYVAFAREVMKPVYYNDTPFKSELGRPVAADAFAGEYAPMALALCPLQDLGKVTVSAGDLTCAAGTIPASAIDVGYVSYRLARVTGDGTVYSINPRYVMPTNTVEMPKDTVRRFWLTARVPADAKPGLYKGKLTIKPEKGQASEMPVELRIRTGSLDALDIQAGPWGYQVPYVDDVKCLKKIREYGFTMFSSPQVVGYQGFKDGKPVLDFTAADKLMATAKEMGFQSVMFYGSLINGINPYEQDQAQMAAAGFKNYSEFIKAVYTDVQKHADEKAWITYHVNLGDEPSGDGVAKSALNAEAYHKAFPKGPPFFSAATSLEDIAKDPEHVRLIKALPISNLNGHNEEVVKMLHDVGNEWAFYNGGGRWTFGDYMFKAAKQFGMKFRIDWHWNVTMGDPYYPLDSREDEYGWCNSSPQGELVPALDFELRREGLGDYRRLLTLQHLAKDKAGTPAAAAAQKLIDDRMASFKLGQRDHDPLLGIDDWEQFRAKVNDAIDALRK